VEGQVVTRALSHVTIGIDNTDSKDGGATFALAFALLNHISRTEGVLPISHHVVMLKPDVPMKTAGNSASYIEFAVEPGLYESVLAKVRHFIVDETFSADWGIAVRAGLCMPKGLRAYGQDARSRILTQEYAERIAQKFGITLVGGNGVIGALGAVALAGLPHEILLDPLAEIHQDP
jgi:tRNA(Ile2) C34 agmatinyltransferase TiaS